MGVIYEFRGDPAGGETIPRIFNILPENRAVREAFGRCNFIILRKREKTGF